MRRRIHSGLTLTVLVIGCAVAMAGVLAAALSLPGIASTEQAGTEKVGDPTASTTTPLADAAMPDPSADRVVGGRMIEGNKTAAAATPVNIGDCVALGDAPRPAKTSCGTGNSGYKVIDKAVGNSTCPSDVDHVHHDPPTETDSTALCLDIDWVVGGCMQLGDGGPKHIDCQTPAAEAVRVLAIKPGTTDITQCPSGNTGFVYDERRIVVCVAHVS